MVVHLNCQLNEVQSHLGDGVLGTSVGENSHWLN